MFTAARITPKRFSCLNISINVFILVTTLLILLSLATLRQVLTSTETVPPMTFTLLVTLVFTAEEHKQTFLQAIDPVVEYVRIHERKTTLAYAVLESDKNPLQVSVLERYTDKDVAYLQIHKSGSAFLEFRPKLQALQEAGYVTISGESYLDAKGYVDG